MTTVVRLRNDKTGEIVRSWGSVSVRDIALVLSHCKREHLVLDVSEIAYCSLGSPAESFMGVPVLIWTGGTVLGGEAASSIVEQLNRELAALSQDFETSQLTLPLPDGATVPAYPRQDGQAQTRLYGSPLRHDWRSLREPVPEPLSASWHHLAEFVDPVTEGWVPPAAPVHPVIRAIRKTLDTGSIPWQQ